MSEPLGERRCAILRPADIAARERGGGAKTIPLVTRKLGATGFINGITIFDPGAAIPLHKHNCDESVMVVEGDAIAEIDGVEHVLSTGDMTFIPAEMQHRFANVSATRALRIVWTYASIDATRTLMPSGDTRRIDAEHGDSIPA